MSLRTDSSTCRSILTQTDLYASDPQYRIAGVGSPVVQFKVTREESEAASNDVGSVWGHRVRLNSGVEVVFSHQICS